NTGDTKIDLERVEASVASLNARDQIGGTPRVRPLRRTIEPRSETRLADSEDWGWVGSSTQGFGASESLATIASLRRFFGREETGRAIKIEVRVNLNNGVGHLTQPPTPPASLPPSKALEFSGLSELVGQWRGSTHSEKSVYNIPVEVTIAPDGAFQAGEYDPVTNRFTGRLRIENGRVRYSQRRDTGFLALY